MTVDMGLVGILVAALFGGGGVVAGFDMIRNWRSGVRDSKIQSEVNAIGGFRELATSLTAEVDRLSKRMDEIETQRKTEQQDKLLALRHIQDLYDWIQVHIVDEQIRSTVPAPPPWAEPMVLTPNNPNKRNKR